MEIVLGIALIIAFIGCVSAYLMGVSHGMRVYNRNVPSIKEFIPKAIKEAIQTPQEPEEDLIKEIMGYSYESAIEAIKKERAK